MAIVSMVFSPLNEYSPMIVTDAIDSAQCKLISRYSFTLLTFQQAAFRMLLFPIEYSKVHLENGNIQVI